MAVAVSYPGVYVREEASGARAIGGVATSVALFIGQAEQGPMDQPTRIFSVADFERSFGATTSGELADQVRQFYLNGGGEAWIMRIAHGDDRAAVTLRNHADPTSSAAADAMIVWARDPGLLGNTIRVEIDYGTSSPEETFNLKVYRSQLDSNGRSTRTGEETFKGLSMRATAPNSAATAINGVSRLITVALEQPSSPAGLSIAALVLASDADAARTELEGIVTDSANALRIQIGDNPPVLAPLTPAASIAGALADVTGQWTTDINTAFDNASVDVDVTVEVTGDGIAGGGVTGGRLLRIRSDHGAVRVTAAATNDVTVALGLGLAAGGIEGSRHGDLRPAANGLVSRVGTSADGFAAWRELASLQRSALTSFTLADGTSAPTITDSLAISGSGRLYDDGTTRSLANVRTVLDQVVVAIAAADATDGVTTWTVARHGGRLALTPTEPTANFGTGASLTVTGATLSPGINVRAYTVGEPGGTPGDGDYQSGSVPGDDGTRPQPPDYAGAYTVIDREVPLFNLMILPRAPGQTDDHRRGLWGSASAFCAAKRAFLIIDPRDDWNDIRAAELGVDAIRLGVETRNAACYWPKLRVADGTRTGKAIDPAGSIAGLMARTDSTRGVWKAPAGLEATIRGVVGLERRLTDDDNGVINPKALNALRVFSAGVVSWGARTLVGFDDSGNIDDKYVPVRRTMLFIEESLYRGLQFAVFEPNDEPLWAQIRLAAGSFMNGLFRQGAFAGRKASDAYFVACDTSTTTRSDIDLGIVNVVVGFAPLKPAEFVILTVKQLAGQAEV